VIDQRTASELAAACRRLAELLEGVAGEPVTKRSDFSVAEVGEQLGRSCSTVRAWLEKDDLHGYKLPGDAKRAAWRVTAEALESFRNRRDLTDVGSWRKGRGRAA